MFEMSSAAMASLIGVIVVVGISMVNEDLNVGIVAIAFGVLVGAVFAGLPANKVMQAWPIDLFMILTGVTFLFGIATTNGTMEKLTSNAIRLAGGNTTLIPVILFALITIITTIGPGNIATVTLMAPVAMAIAGRIGMNAFLMTLLVVGAANGAAFSPIAPTGVISTFFLNKMAPQLDLLGQQLGNLDSLAWKIYFNSEVAQIVGNVGGFFLLGGWAWVRRQRHASLSIDEIAPKPEPFNRHQWLTLGCIGMLVLLVILPSLAVTQSLFTPTVMKVIGNGKSANVGAIAFLLATVLLVLNAGDSKAAIKSIPWSVIVMVGGMGILIDVMDKAGGLNALVNIISTVSTPGSISGVLALVTGIISAYSSSSGVVMPMFLPLVPGLIQQLGGGDAISMISSICVGSHMVDTSPLSLFGAVCIACAAESEDKGKLFRQLLVWGFSMAAVGAVICYLFFGVLGF
ncbi:transporter, UIT1 family (TC 9.B.48) [Propionivibrio dicarboxylicus]|uniref:Transporter, UIT1 family (TC 9.B.48) n=2 Tax=Propionivibrio dicarboxylicus TaxID=83767 RepID=A0A1G8I1Y8_9RHOO|nr:transporter, UIT1 family (TC 9.B.48) [Propionivibrio dicarboxylicus]